MSRLPYPIDTDGSSYQSNPRLQSRQREYRDSMDDSFDFTPTSPLEQQYSHHSQSHSPYHNQQPQHPSSVLDLPQSSRSETMLNKLAGKKTSEVNSQTSLPLLPKQQLAPRQFQQNPTQPLDAPEHSHPYQDRSLTGSPRYVTSQQSRNPYIQYQSQYPTDRIARKTTSNTTDEYEMSTLVNRDLPPIPVDSNSPGEHDPFRDNNSHNPRNFDMVSLDTEQNYSTPFSNHDKPTETSNESSSDQDFESVENRFRRNEKNRIRTLRSKPRFHYTRLPYFTIVVTLIQVIVFIVELVRMRILTGSAFQTQPYFNPMLGPSTYLLINMGARYVPCMHQVLGITNDTTILFPCANSTTVDTSVCNLAELCGLSGIPIEKNAFIPDQWYRIFIPIFLHAGFLHIIFNLLLQVTMGGSIERNIGILKYAIIYIASGIAGFLLGANFTPVGIASTGASGALFGIVATNMILFVYTGKKNTNMYGTKHYTLFIFIMIGEIVVSFVLGLLPGLDNFSHIGGFAMGILMAIVFLKDPYWVYVDGIIVYRKGRDTLQQFVDHWNPMYAIEDKIRTRFYIWIGARVMAFALAIVYFAVLIKNFFKSGIDRGDTCHWCKYINCIPVHGWCDVGQVTVSEVNSPVGTATATPTPTQTPETSMIQKTITTVITSADSLPSSIENSSGHKRDVNANYDVFQASPVVPRNHIDPGDGFVHQQGVGIGIGIYMIIAMFTFGFLKRKRVI